MEVVYEDKKIVVTENGSGEILVTVKGTNNSVRITPTQGDSLLVTGNKLTVTTLRDVPAVRISE
jgi:RNase P/RNase MRP subunit p29